MKLSGENLGKLRAITVDAVVSENALARFLSDRMSLRLGEIVKPDGLDAMVFDLLNWLQARGLIVEFIDALAKDRPNLTESLAALRDIAAAPPTGLEKLRADAGRLGGWLGGHWWLAAASIVLVLAVALVVGLMWFTRPPRLSTEPTMPPVTRPTPSPPVSRSTPPPPVTPSAPQPAIAGEPGEPLPPLHAPKIWENAFIARGERIAYASPDNIYDVLKERIDKAKNSIQIAMYEFTSPEVKDWILAAVARKVKVTLLLGSRASTNSDTDVIAELAKKGVEVIEASRRRSGAFFFYHPKLIVIDETWVLVQTGNLTATSVPSPQSPSGNRDTGIAIESPELAKYFIGLIASDKRVLLAAAKSGLETDPKPDPKYAAFEPVKRFPILRIGGVVQPGDKEKSAATARPIRILPVHAPENYSRYLLELLASAQKSIDIFEPYVSISDKAPTMQNILDAIKNARSRGVTVRLILGRFNPKRTLEKLQACCEWSSDNTRVLNSRSGLNLTNKLIIVDGRVSLVASANWSEAGVAKNREAGLMIDDPEIASYYGKIFEVDWDRGLRADIVEE